MTGVLELPKTEPAIKSKRNGEPKTFRWTRKKYYQLAELGFFEGKRVELIEGEIVEMSPMKQAHATAVRLIIDVLRKIFIKGYVIDSQLPLSFSSINEPEPDVAVVKGEVRDFSQSHPKTAELIIEVSDTTLQNDRTKKASLYAKNKIQDYWILNLQNRCLEVYRRPIRDKKLGFVYTEIQILTEIETVSLLVKPESKIKIADLLP
ncbi:MAG: Uma2 family endonuclease [Acidobacteria bacterium]|nr:Uma2 family endonuclease [Acidobacteriota bacterium]MCA1636833.1 Uma2 family endonuclease [Acidobacteriota bacterium]